MLRFSREYGRGMRGEAEPQNSGFLARRAHALGSRALARSERVNAKLDAKALSRLDAAIQASSGANRQALGIIRTAGGVSHQAAIRSFWGYEAVEPTGARTYNWVGYFSWGIDADPSRSLQTPLAEPLGHLSLDSLVWSHNSLALSVGNILIHCEVPAATNDMPKSGVTTLFLNTREPRLDRLSGFSSDFTGEARLDFGADGTLAHVALGRENSSGYVAEPAGVTVVGWEGLLDSVHLAVTATAEAHKQQP